MAAAPASIAQYHKVNHIFEIHSKPLVFGLLLAQLQTEKEAGAELGVGFNYLWCDISAASHAANYTYNFFIILAQHPPFCLIALPVG